MFWLAGNINPWEKYNKMARLKDLARIAAIVLGGTLLMNVAEYFGELRELNEYEDQYRAMKRVSPQPETPELIRDLQTRGASRTRAQLTLDEYNRAGPIGKVLCYGVKVADEHYLDRHDPNKN
jgi:hypothetical protein